MNKINKTEDELKELVDKSMNGSLVKEILEKLNEIVDWINSQ